MAQHLASEAKSGRPPVRENLSVTGDSRFPHRVLTGTQGQADAAQGNGGDTTCPLSHPCQGLPPTFYATFQSCPWPSAPEDEDTWQLST